MYLFRGILSEQGKMYFFGQQQPNLQATLGLHEEP